MQIQAKRLLQIILNLSLRGTRTSQEYSRRHNLSTLDTFRMIMSHLGTLLSLGQSLLHSIISPTDRTHTHSRPITPAIIRMRLLIINPESKLSTIARRIIATILLHERNKFTIPHHPFSDSHSHNTIVRKFTDVTKNREISRLDRIKLIFGTNNVTRHSSH